MKLPKMNKPGEENVFDDTNWEVEAQEDSGIDLSGAITPTPPGPEDIVRTKINNIIINVAALDLKRRNLFQELDRFGARHEEVLAQGHAGNWHITKAALLDIGVYIGEVVELYGTEKNLAEKMEEWV